MPAAYMGKILKVDLSRRRFQTETVSDSAYTKHLAGVGLAAARLLRDIPAEADALGPDNMLGFVAGLLTGTGSLFSGRWMVAGKSPLTGGWGDANCGGNFAPAIKRCGFDGIFVQGISERPVWLYVNNQTAELRDADDLWV